MNFKKALINSFLLLATLAMLFPVFWMLLLSLKEFPERFSGLGELLFSEFTLSNYTSALSSDSFGVYFLNSLFVSVTVTLANILFCLWSGYAFARRKFFGRNILFVMLLAVLIIPPHVIMIPLYRLMVSFNWINTYYALILPWVVTPFGVFLVKQYIENLPADIEEAALIDGASYWFVIFRIVMPLSKPILVVLAVYIFLANWNTFLFPFLFTNTENMRTLPVGLTFYLGKQSIDWGRLMAGAGISALPVIAMFIAFQKQIIKGLTAGALKG